MTKAQLIACRLRWVILILGLACLAGGIWWGVGPWPFEGFGVTGTPATFLPIELPGELEIAANGVVFLGILLILQWMFLRPRLGWRFRLATDARPMRSAMIAAAFMAMLLTVGMVFTLLELLWSQVIDTYVHAIICWVAMGVLWCLWSYVFLRYWKQDHRFARSGRIIRGLISGSVLELFVATAVFAWNRHDEDCYCSRGSYTGLVFGGAVLLWAFGPGIILLFMLERRRRDGLFPMCRRCGYNLTGNLSGVCPECGTPTEASGSA